MSRDYKGDFAPHERDGVVQTDTIERAVLHSGEVSDTNWGKFEPAIRRWEQVTKRPAPKPTIADRSDGEKRLNVEFSEWVMGLPKGYITDSELSRSEALRCLGNGVVPQQAELALRILLDGLLIELEVGQELSTLDPQTDSQSIGRASLLPKIGS
jgi:hypothetical protein